MWSLADSKRNLSKSFLLKLSHEKGMQDWLLNFTKEKGMNQSNKPSTYTPQYGLLVILRKHDVGGPLNHRKPGIILDQVISH